MNTVIGIDPGLASLGWGVLLCEKNAEDIHYCAHGVIETSPSLELSARLLQIEQKFKAILSRYSPTALGYEKQFFVKNVTSGLDVAHALGVVLLYCAKNNIPACGYTPLNVKKQITGHAQARKESVEKMMCLQLNIDIIRPHHASDALAIALVRCYSIRSALKDRSMNLSIPAVQQQYFDNKKIRNEA